MFKTNYIKHFWAQLLLNAPHSYRASNNHCSISVSHLCVFTDASFLYGLV